MKNINNWKFNINNNIVEIDIGKLIIDKEDLYLIENKYLRITLLSTTSKCLKKTIYNYILNREHNNNNNNIIDHIDGNELNNTKKNLRIITYQQNTFNQKIQKRKKTSKYKGVYKYKNIKNKKYCAYITINKKRISIGYYYTEIEAAKAYDEKAKELFGEYASLNFPEPGQEKYEQKLILEENNDGSVSIDFGKLIIDKDDLEKILSKKWTIYIYINRIQIHNLILNKKNKKNVIDHINQNRLDNRKINLRECSRQENSFNIKSKDNCSSKYKGVSYLNKQKKWCASIQINNKSYNIGNFKNEKDAARHYDAFARYFFKEFAYLNFPNETLDINVDDIINKRKNKKRSSKYIGVCYSKKHKRWISYIIENQKTKRLQYHKTEIEAAKRYNEEAIKLKLKINIL
jgi:hypothetical protein